MSVVLPQLPDDLTDATKLKSFLASLRSAIALLQDETKDTTDSLKQSSEEKFPVGSWYVQYPSAESNDEDTAFPPSQYPSELFGGTWTEKFTGEGVVFQTAETTDHYTRTNGLMEDHLEDHTHYAYIWCSNTTGSGYWCLITRNGSSGQGAFATGVPISGRHGSRTAHRNRVMKLWHRES